MSDAQAREIRRLTQQVADKDALIVQLGELLEAHRRADDMDLTQIVDWVQQIRVRQGVRTQAAA